MTLDMIWTEALSNESEIIKKAKSLKSDDEKIAYIFDAVKNSDEMEWDLAVLYR